jgi:hypothetical protein
MYEILAYLFENCTPTSRLLATDIFASSSATRPN